MKMLLKDLKKHPSPSRELFFPNAFKTGDFSLIVNEQNVLESINFFPAGSSPGEGFAMQRIRILVICNILVLF
jgi:hypothetical protein